MLRLDRVLAGLGERMAAAIPRTPEVVRLWLLISVALEPAVVGRFMGMSAAAIEERVQDARRRMAAELLGKGAPALQVRRSRRVFMAFVDAAARQRAGLLRRRALSKQNEECQ